VRAPSCAATACPIGIHFSHSLLLLLLPLPHPCWLRPLLAALDSDPRAFERGQKEREAGPTMMFAKLNMTTPEGGVRTKGESDALAARWQDLLYTGGIEATAYDLEASKVLLTVQKGHQGEELKDFLVEQEEVLEVEWNSKKYRRPGVKPLPLDPAPSPRKGAKKKKKKRKRKRKRKTPGQRQQKEKAKKE
jgi:hypothetical protein